jgi:cardiolipin synthase
MSISIYNIANLLSLIRILLVPCFVLFLAYHQPGWALTAFLAAAVTDYLDGLAARRLHTATQLGAFLDPLADKLLVISAYVMLTLAGKVALWMTVVVITRDVLVVAGFILLAVVAGITEIKASWWGKAATALQLGLLALALALRWEDLTPGELSALAWGFGITVILTFLSGMEYLVRGILKFEAGKGLSG